MGGHQKLLLFLATFSHHAGVGSSFVFVPCNHAVSRRVRLCMSSADISDSETNDYDDNNYDSPSISNEWDVMEWEYPYDSESDGNTSPAVSYEEVDNVEKYAGNEEKSEEDVWIEDIIDEIHNEFHTLGDGPLYDTSFDEPTAADRSVEEALLDNMDEEISMLVRCNEQPDALLIEEGRALAPLAEEERNSISQLIVWKEDSDKFEVTDFLRHAVSKMFKEHAKPSVRDGILSMDRRGVAAWMTKSLQEEEKYKVSQNDKRVLRTMSDFSVYGSGRLVEEDFQKLYFQCIIGDIARFSSGSLERHFRWRNDFRDAVWRDIRGKLLQRERLEEVLHFFIPSLTNNILQLMESCHL